MKDGREVLVWAYGQICVIYWGGICPRWLHGEDYDWPDIDQITHWSEANPPEGAE
jgi:hypothetical protein